ADLFFKFFDQLAGKSVLVNRKGLLEPHASHLPMSGGSVFSGGTRGAFAVSRERSCRGRLEFQWSEIGEAELNKIGNLQRPRFGDMAQSISSRVAVIGRVWQFTDSDTVQNNPEDSRVRVHARLHSPFDKTLSHPNRGESWAKQESFLVATTAAPCNRPFTKSSWARCTVSFTG